MGSAPSRSLISGSERAKGYEWTGKIRSQIYLSFIEFEL